MSAISTSSQPVRLDLAAEHRAQGRRRWGGRGRRLGFLLLVTAIVVFCLAPIVWTLLTSLKTNDQLYAFPIAYWPNPINFTHYVEIFGLERFTKSLLNSAIVATASTGPMKAKLDPR